LTDIKPMHSRAGFSHKTVVLFWVYMHAIATATLGIGVCCNAIMTISRRLSSTRSAVDDFVALGILPSELVVFAHERSCNLK
jgi:hypothetical protein